MFKVLTKGCEPSRGSKYSACVDLRSAEDVVIGAGETKLVGLGVAIDLENSNVYKTSGFRWASKKGAGKETLEDIKQQEIRDFMIEHYLQLMLRSSLGKKGLILPNGVGIIDLDYDDEIKMIIHNARQLSFGIKKGDRIAQITLLEHKSYLMGVDTDEERNGGFGSTGK